MSDRLCDICSTRLPEEEELQSAACPNCGHIPAQPEALDEPDSAGDGLYSLVTSSDGATGHPESASEPTRQRLMPVRQGGSETTVLDIEVTGQIVTEDGDDPGPVVVRRRKKKPRRNPQCTDDLNSFAIKAAETFVTHFKLILFVVAWGIVIAVAKWNPIASPSQEVYYNQRGDGKTTSEWLNFIRHYERESAGGRISVQGEKAHLVVTARIETCIGADPLAVQDLLVCLTGNPKGRLYSIAETVLEKFENTGQQPPLEDLVAGIETGHPRITYWSIRLMALHGHAASEHADKVAEYVVSRDDALSEVATATLAEIK